MRTIRFHPRISWSPLPGESWHLTINRSGCRGVLGLVPQPLCMKFQFAQKRANLGSSITTDQSVCQVLILGGSVLINHEGHKGARRKPPGDLPFV